MALGSTVSTSDSLGRLLGGVKSTRADSLQAVKLLLAVTALGDTDLLLYRQENDLVSRGLGFFGDVGARLPCVATSERNLA